MAKKTEKVVVSNIVLPERTGLPSVKGVMPAGSLLLLEVLTEKEILEQSGLYVPDSKVIPGAPRQAYVKEVGPLFNPDNYGFGKGSRVLFSGSHLSSVPRINGNSRELLIADPSSVKCVLMEDV